MNLHLRNKNTAEPEGFSQQNKAEKPKMQKPGKTPLTHRTWAKVTAFMLAVIMLAATAACVAGAVVMAQQEIYSTPKDKALEDVYNSVGHQDSWEIIDYFQNYDAERAVTLANSLCEGTNIYSAQVINRTTGESYWSFVNNTAPKTSDEEQYNVAKGLQIMAGTEMPDGVTKLDLDYISFNVSADKDKFDDYDYFYNSDGDYGIDLWVYDEPAFNDEYMLVYNVINLLYAARYWVYVIGITAFAGFIALVVFLLCASGHRKGCNEIQPGWGTRVPFDLLTAAVIACGVLLCELFDYVEYIGTAALLAALIIGGISAAAIVLGYAMSLAVRIKLGKWWKNTIIYCILLLLWKGVKALFRLLKQLPLVSKAAFIVLGVSIIQLLLMMMCWDDYGIMVALWVVSTIVLGGAVLYCAICLKKLQKAGQALAEGDLSYQVDTERLYGDLKKHGESLNSIAEGMTIAVEERMKSERMKTELITNVSHDIKTPLTSIINYTDLISREPCDNEKINEYSQVLLRQSERLKRLIEDLVEASKASTGNIEVHLTPCEANILLTQAVGEYQEKLAARDLQLITNQPKKSIIIMADGRRLWRVFDNLINNVCKYAQSNTRVYLSLEERDGKAVITLKNTSRAPLNISADELMERFVRGDKSRNTEGNGLGLSIAKSLTELQNGTLELTIDGDLFKVTLKFPVVK